MWCSVGTQAISWVSSSFRCYAPSCYVSAVYPCGLPTCWRFQPVLSCKQVSLSVSYYALQHRCVEALCCISQWLSVIAADHGVVHNADV